MLISISMMIERNQKVFNVLDKNKIPQKKGHS